MPCSSRQEKKASRPVQHFARCVRSGAIGVPSVDSFGCGGVEGEEENQPIFFSCLLIEMEYNLFAIYHERSNKLTNSFICGQDTWPIIGLQRLG